MRTAELSIYLRIRDPKRLIAAGRRQAIVDGATNNEETAVEVIADDDYGTAIRFLIDRAEHLGLEEAGLEILDTTCEVA